MAIDTLWQTKLHARLHDPAEKALVLLRDPEGHEGGTSRALHRDLGFESLPVKDWLDPDNPDVLDKVLFQGGIPITMYRDVQRADWWASGADRPQWPMQEITVTTRADQTRTLKVADWAQVRWTKEPILIHPLTGQSFDLRSLADTDIADIKQRSFVHFSRLTVKNGDAVDWMRTLLAYWRFGPELCEDEDNGKLGLLWPLLPADTRVPEHSIWDHLDLTSAFAGAFAADSKGDAALLALSLGPVQSFIAAARSTSDLWAGSHLLSRLSWEAMKPVCERLGPDAILFPRLRGLPQVDLWLRQEIELPTDWFEGDVWQERATDANPLFAAALPNRFVAVVPPSQVADIVREVSERVRTWLQNLGKTVVERLLAEAGFSIDETAYAFEQMQRQLGGFPEVHWAAVPFSLIRPRNPDKQTDLEVAALNDAMAPFFGVEQGKACGFLDSPAWRVLQKDIRWTDNTTFFAPKPGVLYPAVYDLAERVLAAAKSAHRFDQLEQAGWRDSLTGESEWLSVSREELSRMPGRRGDTLWARVARNKPAWAKEGEHLGALSAIKRLWPTMFAEEVRDALGVETVPRFVVSTHTMALAARLDSWLERGAPMTEELRKDLEEAEPVALPRRLMRFSTHRDFDLAKRLPDLLERAADDPDETRARRAQSLIRRSLASGREAGQTARIETYYALLMMDGDEMGAWLSGNKDYASYRDCFHPTVRRGFDQRAAENGLLEQYGRQSRAVSPNRHLAISAALNDFALHAVPEVIERQHAGRVIYAGGDDVLAMLPVADLLPAMQRLRQAYSGHSPLSSDLDWRQARHEEKLVVKDGFGLLGGRLPKLLRLLGEKATASCGAVIAHHQAPLAAVLRELRTAEQRAKSDGGRDAWSLALIKRSGGTVHLTAKWGEPLGALEALCGFLADPEVSRRAVYNTLEWIEDLPRGDATLIETLLAYQLERQAEGEGAAQLAAPLAQRLIKVAFDAHLRPREVNPVDWLKDFLIGGEFLAREVRR
jgi:CRISPR-associated protein Cmr2